MWELRLRIWPGAVLLLAAMLHSSTSEVTGRKTQVFLNQTSSTLILPESWNLRSWTQLSFRTCSFNGEVLSQEDSSGQFLRLHIHNGSLVFSWNITNIASSIRVQGKYNTNKWVTVSFKFYLGEVYFNVTQGRTVLHSSIIASLTTNQYLLMHNVNSSELKVGRTIIGCINQGPGVDFNLPTMTATNVIWNNCSVSPSLGCTLADLDGNDCISLPCKNGGTCQDGINAYTCLCPHNFNGTNCETDLRPLGCSISPCLNAGTCVSVPSNPARPYRCTCANGYTGSDCELVIDHCQSQPCLNNGVCSNNVGDGYQCNCTGTGHEGLNCETDINECVNVDCGAGTCYDYPSGFSCQCPVGYNGDRCQDDIDECVSSPCKNDGQCNNDLDSFSCTCQSGFTGTFCELNIDDCVGVVCQSTNATCKDLVNSHECVCKPGFTGTDPNCIDIDECAPNPCVRDQSLRCDNLINRFHCQCKPGFTGDLCETDIDECQSDPCQNNATCVQDINDYRCNCLPGYDGKNCTNNINDCLLNICQNGGTCFDLVNDYRCDCIAGWTSKDCSVNFNDCASNPCLNNATCNDYLNYYNCSCVTGFRGARCEENIDDCANNPCNNNGRCEDLIDDYRCVCTSEWMGKNCSETYNACIDLTPCQNNATCETVPPSRNYTCDCVSGFTNTNCSLNIDDCAFNNCTPYQQCYDGINTFTCGCPPGFEGALCDVDIDECAGNRCQNNATCINGTGDYTCQCHLTFYNLTQYVPGKLEFYSGYKGKYCSEDIDECQYNPCLNGGNCNNNNGSFICFCPGGKLTTGYNCELLTTYCDIKAGELGRPPCKNGGTCQSNSRGFVCSCAPGWHGSDCGVNINECESEPCQNMGTCLDGINGYNCTCIPGITGANCEENIDECNSQPCLNGGHCLDQINQYICNCTDTGFKGNNCKTNIDDCIGDPCFHGGTCQDGIKKYTCNCYGGYSGKNCDYDIKECEAKPCQYGGTCLERSNQTLYDMNVEGFSNFSYATADGYKCLCIPGITGDDCDVNIDECLSTPCLNGATCNDAINSYRCECAPGYEGPHCQLEINECERYRACQNGAKCKDLIADYHCDCLPYTSTSGGYGGKNCSVRLTGCDNRVLCQRGSSCIPNYDQLTGLHDYTCDCLNGYTGRYCNISTTVTLRNDAFVRSRMPQAVNEVSFRFRTSLDEGILMSYGPLAQSEYLIIQIQEMKLKVEYTNQVSTMVNSIPVNDGNWHDVKISIQENVTVSLDSSLCHQVSDCTIKFQNYATTSSTGDLYFGSSFSDVLATRKSYIGCMQDVIVNGLTIIDTEQGYSFFSTIKGCPRTEQCGPYTCDRHGDCKDLWYTYQCDCYRPYLGTNCTDEFVPATFAKDNKTSFASFLVPDDLKSVLENEFEFSLFVQTRQENSVIMYIGNSDSSILTFVTLEMIGGKLGGRISFCNIRDSFVSNQFYQDGDKYFVNLSLKSGIFTFSVKSDIVNKTINNSGTCPLQANIFFVGGRTPSFSVPGRRKREVFDQNSITDFSTANDFEGIIQDIEINKKKFEFYAKTNDSQPASAMSNLTEGAVSTRDVCQDQPCENGGTCNDIVYNDFRCDCPKGYIGKNCSALDFCKSNSCPVDAECQSRTDGFECIASATFNGQNSLVKYRADILNTTNLDMLSFHFITHSQYATIFYLNLGIKFIKVRLVNGHVQLNYKLTNEMSSFLDLKSPVNDGEWYVVEVELAVNSVILRTKQNDTILEEETSSVTNLDITEMIKNRADLFIGGTGLSRFSNRWEQSYKGCLKEFRLGSVLLPFFNDDQFINNTSQEKFIVQTKQSVVIGCDNGNSCLQDGAMCLHGSQCQNIWNGFQCQCITGFEGTYCQSNRDECPTIDCGSGGKCIDGIGTATCQCPKSLTGNRCQTDVDFCSNDSCYNNGSCYELDHDFGCNCSGGWTGKSCNVLKNSNCSEEPCKNNGQCTAQTPNDGGDSFNCSCLNGYLGTTCEVQVDYCIDLPCKNGGNCTVDLTAQNFYTCSCPDGFDGSNCENNKNDCTPGICRNEGTCEDLVNEYYCNCTEGWKGKDCETNVDECNETLPCQLGECVDTQGSYTCDCTGTGYNGANCSDEVDECNLPVPPCKNGAGCTNTEGSYECNCTIGYNGTDCTIPSCTDNQCINNSTCTITPSKKWKCNCLEFYYGKFCETAGPCTNNYCSADNTVFCSQNESEFSYTCHCKPGWKGENCTEDVNECDSKPCKNGGTCNNTIGSYHCDCVLGYTGPNCSININDCPGQCKNNGTCTDLVNDFSCQCTDAYTGKTCEEDVNECNDASPICQNNQSCENTIGSYICQCSDDYLGKNCEYDNPCTTLVCENGGSCNKTYNDNRYEAVCACVVGFEGVLCEKADPSVQPVDDSVDIWVIIGPIIAIIIIIVIIGVVVFLVTARNKRATRGQYCPSQQETAGARVELGNVLKRPPTERLI